MWRLIAATAGQDYSSVSYLLLLLRQQTAFTVVFFKSLTMWRIYAAVHRRHVNDQTNISFSDLFYLSESFLVFMTSDY
jgi:hypothetical protein